jgi:hypothetical protein
MLGRCIHLVFCVALTAVVSAARADETAPPPDPDLGTQIADAAVLDDQLWVLGPQLDSNHGGAVVSFALSDGTRQLRMANGIAALKKVGERLFILCPGDRDKPIQEWKGGAFVPLKALNLKKGERPDGLLTIGDRLGVETPASLFVLDGEAWKKLYSFPGFTPPKDAFSADAFGLRLDTRGMPASATSLYTGFNQGEWGGGLSRIDLSNGKVNGIESSEKGPDGYGLYDPSLDPVNAIISDPDRNDCVIVAVGLIHFEASGKLLRVCADQVSLRYSNVVGTKGYSGKTIYNSEAFFGLVPAKDGFWAVSDAAVYRFGPSGDPKRLIFSKFELWHGLWIDREVDGVIVLVTEINRRFSVNGGTPLIVPIN